MNSFDEIQVDELANDDAYAEWLWRHEMDIRESLDRDGESLEEINKILAEAACEPCPF